MATSEEEVKKKWVSKRFDKWTFEYQAYAEDSNLGDIQLKKNRIPYGGLVLRNVYHDDYRFAYDIRTNAIFVFSTEKAKNEGYCDKKFILNPVDFEQLSMIEAATTDFGPTLFDKGYSNNSGKKADIGKSTGIPYNFDTFNYQIEGELLVRWKSRNPVFGPNSHHLYVTQKIIFTRYSGLPSHEPNGVLTAARVHPLTKVYYENKNDGYFKEIRIDYRLHLNVDQAPLFIRADDPILARRKLEGHKRNHAALFRDDDEARPDSFRDAKEFKTENVVFESAEKPIIAEVIGEGIVKGKNRFSSGKYTWDNIHYWGAGGNLHASAPGDFHGIHLHWRWGKILREKASGIIARIITPIYAGKPQYKGKGKEGILVDPNFKNQSLSFALIAKSSLPDELPYSDQSTKNFSDFFISLYKTFPDECEDKLEDGYYMMAGQVHPQTINTSPDGGENLVTFYSCTIHKDQTESYNGSSNALNGYVFLHGIFFGHEPERPEQLLKLDHPLIAGVGSHGEFYLAPVKKLIDKTPRDWSRNPDIK